jgi:hypothetical protein
MLKLRGDLKKKEQEALYFISSRRRKKEGAVGTTCYRPEET